VNTFFASTAADWRAWLAQNCRSEKEVWLVIYHKDSGTPSVRYNEAIEHALLRVDRQPSPQARRGQLSAPVHPAQPAQHVEPGEPAARRENDRAGPDDRARSRPNRADQGRRDVAGAARR